MFYPNHLIKQNQKTQGGELALLSNPREEYKGFYFITHDGKYFTGKNPFDKPNNQLIPLTGFTDSSQIPENPISEPRGEAMNVIFDRVYSERGTLQGEPPSKPKNILPNITPQDYKKGEITRFFLKKNNENSYIETDQEGFELFRDKDDRVAYQLYTPFSLPWVISGDKQQVFQQNQQNVIQVAKKLQLVGFKEYFKNHFMMFFRD